MAYQPKSYRKFIAGAATAAVVASSFAGVAGAASFTDVNDNYKEAVDFLVSKGIQGISETEFGTYNNIKRVDAAVFVAKALDLDVDAAPASGFTDVPERAVKEVNALKEAGITNGKTATSFGAQDLITRGELAIWLDRAFDLEGEGDVSAFTDATGIYTDAIKALVANEITNGTTATTFGTKDFAKRGDFAVFVKKSADTVVAPVEELEVESVSAINLREVVVTFNSLAGADLDELKDESNYDIEGNNPEKVTVDEEANTVTILLSESNALGNYSKENELTIAKVVGLADDFEVEFSATDTVLPTIESVEAPGPRTLKVVFSEPVEIASGAGSEAAFVNSFKLDNGSLALSASSADLSIDGREVTIKTLSDLEEGQHTLELKDTQTEVVDAANYKAIPKSLKFEYVKDTSEPVFTVKESTETAVTIEFNKAVDPSTIVGNTNVRFTHTYNNSTNEVDGTAVTREDDTTYEISFAGTNPFPPGESTIWFYYDDEEGNLVEDYYGNEVAEASFTVTTTADNTKPEVEKVEFDDATHIKVHFSEDVSAATALDKSNYELKDSSDDKVNIKSASWDGDSRKVVILETDTLNGGSYKLAVEDVKDISIAENKMTDQTITFSATDKVAPTVKDQDTSDAGVQVQQIGTDKVKVIFSEAMDVASITDKDNWKRNGAELHEDDTIEVTDNNKAVIITFEDTTLDTTDAGSDGKLDNETLSLARVKDAAGNWIEAFNTTLEILAVAPIEADKVQLISDKKVKVIFEDEVISGATTDDFQIYDGASWTANAVTGVSTSVVDGDTEITLTLASSLGDTEVGTLNVRTVDGTGSAAAAVNGKNAYDTSIIVTAGNVTIEDKAAPEIVSYQSIDSNSDGVVDQIDVTFSENLYTPSISESDFEVEGYTIDSIDTVTASDVVSIILDREDDAEFDTGATFNVTLVGAVEDDDRNVLNGADKEETTDAASAVILSATSVDNTTIELTLSEDVTENLLADGTGWSVADSAGTPNTYAVSVQAFDGSKVTLTVADYSGATGDVKVSYTTQTDKNEDAAGNDLASAANVVVE